jgi:hypothetical protein
MTRTCFVHIGMHKSGSTAIQTAFDGYDDGKTKMLQVGHPNHSLFLLTLFSTTAMREEAGRQIGVQVESLDTYARSLRDAIIAQFQDGKANFVISGEELSARLTGQEVANVKTFLSAWFDDIRIIVYLRDPVSYMRSAFQQVARGSAIAFDFELVQPNYRKRIADWIEVFGRDKVCAVPYDRKAFVEGSIIHDFAHRIGADVSRVGPQIGNESMRAEGFALAYAIRNTLGFGKPSWMRRIRLRADLYMIVPEYGQFDFDFSDNLFEAALEKQKDQIAWAEDLMKRPFPVPKRAVDAIIFGSHDDIMQYANQCRAGFDHWKRRNFTLVRRLRYLVRVLRRGIV